MDVIPSDIEEPDGGLWALTVGPAIWAGHFLASYIAAAVWCGRAGAHGPSRPVMGVFVAGTMLALAGVVWVGWRGWVRYNHGETVPSHHKDTPEDRRRFLGLATLLLAMLGGVSIAYTALAVAMMRGCS